MQYVMASKWSLLERFEITDASGAPQFEARGHLGSQITLHDTHGQEVADIRKHLLSDTHEVYVGGQRVEVADNENQVFGLTVVLAIEAIHAERENQDHRGGFGPGGGAMGGMGGGIGGILGGSFP
jgi:uncharacterized protein YxjI